MLSRIRLISRAYASKIFTAALIVGITLSLSACGATKPDPLPAHVRVAGGQYIVDKGWSNLGRVLCEEGYGGINWHEIQVPEGEIIVCEHAQKSFSYGPTRMLK